MLDQIREFFKKKNQEGFFVPTISDPVSGRGSVSLTLVFLSFNLCLIGIVGKWSKVLDIDVSQATNLFMICAGLYWGRKFQKDDKKISVEAANDQSTKEN